MPQRDFVCDDVAWIAWVSGAGAYGSGAQALGHIEAVHFARHSAPDVPVLEALLPRGAFDGLFDEELIALLRSARPIVDASQLPAGATGRRSRTLE